MATRNDVAKLAGVSTATVSHVLKNTKYVSDELKERVYAAVEQLNYIPNHAAQMLKTKRTNQITMLVSDISNPYYGEIAAGMEEATQRNKYVLSICSTEGAPDTYITKVIERQTDGAFLAVTDDSFSTIVINKLINQGIPVVIAGTYEVEHFKDKVSRIVVSYEAAMEQMMNYLHNLGHRNVGYLVGLSEETHDTRLALFSAYRDMLGFNPDENYLVFGNFPYRTNFESGYDSMKRLLAIPEMVTAVFCTNDLMAFGAIKAIREVGLRIPDDISIVGCDNIFFSECADPPLSTISIPKRDMGRKVVDLLFGAIHKGENATSRVNGEFLIRSTTGPVRNR